MTGSWTPASALWQLEHGEPGSKKAAGRVTQISDH